jgi:hypothetical protein
MLIATGARLWGGGRFEVGFHSMRLTTAALALLIATAVNDQVRAADSCKACSDYRKRCMANYPGPRARSTTTSA